MRLFKSLKSRLGRRKRLADANYHERPLGNRSVGKIVLNIVLFPIRVLFLPFKAMGIFHDTGVKLDEYDKNISFKKRLKRFGKSAVLFPFRLLLVPVKFFKLLWAAGRKEMLFVLPALAVIGFFGFVFVQVFARGSRIEYRYQKGALDAVEDEDFELAKTYYQRIIADHQLTPPQQYQWAMILANTDETVRAEAVMEQLAPDDEIGFGPAHSLKALSTARQISTTKDPKILKKLRWHLINSRDTSPRIQQAWAAYYMAIGNTDDAIAALEAAAVMNPTYYQNLAAIYKQEGRDAKSQAALSQAAEQFERVLEKDKLDHLVRIYYANSLAQLEKYDDAEDVLKQGVRLQPDADIKRAMADFYVMRYEVARKEGADTAVQLQFLIKSLNFNPNFDAVYSRMITLFMDANKSLADAASIKKEFEDVITSDNPTALAHFALSNILWQEGDRKQAQFHLEQAYMMNKQIVIVLNNLAYMLAVDENPDLERALEFSQAAVEQVPKNTQFRDTLGTIYLKLKRYKEASTELQLALPGEEDKRLVHRKLAECYEALGMDELAASHRQRGADTDGENK